MASRGEVQVLFGDFLRARRAERTPEDVALSNAGRRRRVVGLRREEVAQLAGVSADYYARLEQGRLPPPSHEVLEALSEALRLDDDQRAYMRELAAHSHELRQPARSPSEETVTNQTRALINSIGAPALGLGRAMDVLAWNTLAAAFFVDFAQLQPSERNIVRLLFLDERMRSLYADWSYPARVAAAMLRMRAGRFPHDPRLAQFVDELTEMDEDFRHWWNSHQVITHSPARRSYNHPTIGEVDLEWCELTSSAQPEIMIVVLTPADARSERRLRLLAAMR